MKSKGYLLLLVAFVLTPTLAFAAQQNRTAANKGFEHVHALAMDSCV